MIDFRTIFEQAYPGKDTIYEEIILPIFKTAKDLRKTAPIALAESDTQTILQASIIAQVSGTFPITFADVTVQSSVHLKRSRVSIQNCIRKIMEDNTSALIFFHFADNLNEWRVSFVHRAETLKTSTSAKRYTYLCGTEHPCRTIAERFQKLAKKADEGAAITVDDMLNAFSVEALSKEFYKALFNWYEWALKLVTFPIGETTKNTKGGFNVKQSGDNNEINLIRLITRLMFVWFIKQKELIPSWIFDINELKNILTDFNPNNKKSGNYYNAIIQNLFFATLNRKIEDRAFADDKSKSFNKQFGVKNYYRDNCKKTFFKKTNKEIIDHFKSVPFLNGGLFECLDALKDDENKQKNIEVLRDGFSREPYWMAFIPNHLFWQEDDGGHEGLIHILNRYNFTVEENTPSNVQIALDPELLGKVFENLLGTYNPETSKTARKGSGSFYTPREIVDFMVDESLKTYLLQNVKGMTDDQTKILFDNNIDSYNECNKEAIIIAVKNIKILDPACGSGAFPMGALHRMVQIIQKCGGTKDDEKSVYQLKLSLIENCLYGVDIQPIAVQICKLRFFISLICEQEKNNSIAANYGFDPLPNLETKFVVANTLISKKQSEQSALFEDPEINKIKQDIKKVRHAHFNAATAKAKAECREEDKKLRKSLADLLAKDRIYNQEEARQLAAWNPYDQTTVSPFFDKEWMFDIKDGFDIVIGNPPYISTKDIPAEAKKMYEAEFGFNDDTYNLFTFKGLELTKNNGSLNYIIPKTFWTTQTKRNMRNLILDKNIQYIFDTANPFETVLVDTCIIQISNTQFEKSNTIKFIDGSENLHKPIIFAPVLQEIYRNTQNMVIFKPTEKNLKIWQLYGAKVKELYDQWWNKIETSKKIAENAVELKKYRESLKPGDIALLGCLTEGGQGLATGNNGKYIAIRKNSKWADTVIDGRPKKLIAAMKAEPLLAKELGNINPKEYLTSLSESEIAEKFDSIKEKYGRDIFGQGYIYKLIEEEEIADVEKLTDDDKDGNRWYLETPFAIAWSKENVQFLKTNSGKKGVGMPVVRNPQFNFKEGFCWNNVLNPKARLLKVKMKSASVNDVGSMSLSTLLENIPNYYLVCVLNSDFIFDYYREFINCTVNIQINDIRQIPIIIPTKESLKIISKTFQKAIDLKKSVVSGISFEENNALEEIEKQINAFINTLYAI